jgi:hypothetical protein
MDLDNLTRRLALLGFAIQEDDDPDPRDPWVAELSGGFTIKVETHQYKWEPDGTTYGRSVYVPLDVPKVSLYLPHQCDEWDIAWGAAEEAAEEAAAFARKAQQAADLMVHVSAAITLASQAS